MAINWIQFPKGLSLGEFLERYGTEAQCEEALVEARWPGDFRCPACSGQTASTFRRDARCYWQCRACRHQCSLTSGTLLEHSRLPLTKWFLAIYLVTQSKTQIAALTLRRQRGVSWTAAWLQHHKLMEAMHQREAAKPLSGDVRIDDAYLSGERTGGKAGRGSENKVPFVAAVEMRDGRPQRVRFDLVTAFSFEGLTAWAAKGPRTRGDCHFRWPARFRGTGPTRLYPPPHPRWQVQGGVLGRALQVAQYLARQPEDGARRNPSRLRISEVWTSLPCRSSVPIQPPL